MNKLSLMKNKKKHDPVVYIKPKTVKSKPMDESPKKATFRISILRYLRITIPVMVVVATSVLIIVKLRPHISRVKLDQIYTLFSSKKYDEIITTKTDSVVYSDPYSVMYAVKKHNKNVVLIDLRTKDMYEKVYVRESENVPFLGINMKNKDLEDFNKHVQKVAYDKQIILMPYSSSSTSGEEAFYLLRHKIPHVSVLKIGWNELYNLPNLWLPEEEWDSFDFHGMLEFGEK